MGGPAAEAPRAPGPLVEELRGGRARGLSPAGMPCFVWYPLLLWASQPQVSPGGAAGLWGHRRLRWPVPPAYRLRDEGRLIVPRAYRARSGSRTLRLSQRRADWRRRAPVSSAEYKAGFYISLETGSGLLCRVQGRLYKAGFYISLETGSGLLCRVQGRLLYIAGDGLRSSGSWRPHTPPPPPLPACVGKARLPGCGPAEEGAGPARAKSSRARDSPGV
jgi:hypothetical protein